MNTPAQHLDALQLRLSNERVRLANAQNVTERGLRSVWIMQIEREIAHELQTFGSVNPAIDNLDDDGLLAALDYDTAGTRGDEFLCHLTQNQPENANMRNFTIDDLIIKLLTRGHVSELEAQQMIADAADQAPLPELN